MVDICGRVIAMDEYDDFPTEGQVMDWNIHNDHVDLYDSYEQEYPAWMEADPETGEVP